MSDLTKYGISLEVKAAMASLTKFKNASQKFNKQQESALKTQIRLQQQLNKLQGGVQRKVSTPPTTSPRVQPAPKPEIVGPKLNPLQRRSIDNQVRQTKQLAAAEERRLKALTKAKSQVESSAFMMKRGADETTRSAQAAIKLSMASAKTADEVREAFRFHKNNTAQLRQQNFLMRRMQQSSEQFAGNMVSAFAIAAGGSAITRVGQDFEAVNNTMLAVSENSEQAGENFKFVKDEAFRLGLGLKESAKGFAKMVSARGEMTLEDTKEVFTGVSEMGTLLGLSAEESGRATNAIQQMMSKTTITAEELKLQLGEVMPNAIQLMAKSAQDAGLSLNGTVAEMMDLQQRGELISATVLPHFARNLREAAAENGGLESALNSNRVAMNQMTTSFQVAADEFFKSGFAEGLTDTFKSIGKLMKENTHIWKALGKIFGSALKGIAMLIDDILNPILSALGSILHTLTKLFGDFSGILLAVTTALGPVGTILRKVWNVMSGGQGVLGALTKSVKRFLLPLYAALAVLEELAEFLAPTGKKTLIGTNLQEVMESSGVMKIIDRVESMFAMLSSITNSSNGGSVSAHGMNGSPQKGLSYLQMQAGQSPTVVLQGDVYMDSQVVGQQVMRSEAASSEIDTRISGYVTGNR